MAIKVAVFHSHQGLGQQFRDLFQAHQYAIFLMCRVNSANARRFEPYDCCVVTGGYGETLDTIAIYVQRKPSPGLIAIRKTKSAGADNKVAAVAPVTTRLYSVA